MAAARWPAPGNSSVRGRPEATLHGVVFAIFVCRPSVLHGRGAGAPFSAQNAGFVDVLPEIPRRSGKSRVLAPPGLW
jgi:hypothetical protein